jgi:hypothetical protein
VLALATLGGTTEMGSFLFYVTSQGGQGKKILFRCRFCQNNIAHVNDPLSHIYIGEGKRKKPRRQ